MLIKARIVHFLTPGRIFLLFLLLLSPGLAQGQQIITEQDTINLNDSIPTDSLALAEDTLDYKLSSSAIDQEIKYHARDTIIADIKNKRFYLIGEAHVEYGDMTMDAANIEIDWSTNIIHAYGATDSLGALQGTPHFKDKDQEFDAKEVYYNFQTKKGRLTELFTQESTESFIHGGVVKSIKSETGEDDILYIRNGKYTTCNLKHPHYHLQTNKLKLIPKKRVITGPAYMVVSDVPVPLVLPFGFFPANSRKTSGIIIPTIGEDNTRGFALTGLGYYYGGSDYFDVTLTSDLYTDGSYSLNWNSNYALRYKFNGNIGVSYARNQFGLKETKDFRVDTDFVFTWVHSQDLKARPGSNFNAQVTIPTKNFYRNNTFDINSYATQNVNSSIAYNKQFVNTPFSFSTAANHSQNLATGLVDITLPQFTFNMNRIQPFLKQGQSAKNWLDKASVSYTLNATNRYSAGDTVFFENMEQKSFNNGFNHRIPIQTTIPVFKYLSFSPNITYDGYFFTKRIDVAGYDTSKPGNIAADTVSGIYPVHALSGGANINTVLYGMFNINKFNIMAIRHRMDPSVGFSFLPNLGYENLYTEVPVPGVPGIPNAADIKVGRYDQSLYGLPGDRSRALLNFNLNNNFEMKARTKVDTGYTSKKYKILDQLNINTNYDLLADSFALTPVSVSAVTSLFNKLNINSNIIIDPYYYDSTARARDMLAIKNGQGIGHINRGYLNLSTSLNPQGLTDKRPVRFYRDALVQYYYPEMFADFDVPWNLSLSYTMNYSTQARPYKGETFFAQDVNHIVTASGNLGITEKWDINFQTSYDFKVKDFSQTQFVIRRDLHCWEMSFSWIPFGPRKHYLFNIHVKASSLQDLKFERRKQPFNY